jgi:hypothetical protein
MNSEQIQRKKDAIAAIHKEQVQLITSLSSNIVRQYRKPFIARCNRKPKLKKVLGIMASAFKAALALRSLEIKKQMIIATPIRKNNLIAGANVECGLAIVGENGSEVITGGAAHFWKDRIEITLPPTQHVFPSILQVHPATPRP